MFSKLQKTISVPDEQTGNSFFVDYFITDEQSSISESMGVVTYGVSVKKRLESEVEADTATAPSLFTSLAEAEAFADTLARNAVTPVSLLYIVEDYLAEQQVCMCI